MDEGTFDYRDGDMVCEGFVARPDGDAPRPVVLVGHAWGGQSDVERDKARSLARLGYVGVAIDVYGKGKRGGTTEENTALMGPWLGNRAGLRQRLLAAVAAAKALPGVDGSKVAFIGYCFGGLCALDVARSGTDEVAGVVSLHGIFPPPNVGAQGPIKAKVLVCHGWDDPMAPPADVVGLAKELTEAGADWQLHAYGHAKHSFTHRHANDPANGVQYNEAADRRSTAATEGFLAELFG